MAENPITKEETKVILFSGKGGVGKTTIAAATALSYALEGERTLIISTDPTPSLSHIFETKLEYKPSMFTEHLKTAPRIYSQLKIAKESKSSVFNIIDGWKKLSLEDMSFLKDNVRLVTIREGPIRNIEEKLLP